MIDCEATQHLIGIRLDDMVDSASIDGGSYHSNTLHGISIRLLPQAHGKVSIDSARLYRNGTGTTKSSGVHIVGAESVNISNSVFGIKPEKGQRFGITVETRDGVPFHAVLRNRCVELRDEGAFLALPSTSLENRNIVINLSDNRLELDCAGRHLLRGTL
jgi:hypothetical protein